MEFGLSLCSEVGRWDDTVAQARLAEELGFESVWLPEHHLTPGYTSAPLIGLGGLVEITSRVRLGTDVLLAPFYHPVRLAEDTALLQQMSRGRLILGVGLGYRPEEFAALAVPYADRGRRFDETLELLGRLWREEHVSFSGRHFTLDDVTIYPRIPDPPPVYVGGWAKAAIRRAAVYGDAYFPGPTADVDTVRGCIAQYDRALAACGKARGELPVFREVWVADSPRHLEAGLAALRTQYEDDYRTWGHSNVTATSDALAERFLVGDPSSVAEQILTLAETLGMTQLIARMHFHHLGSEDVLRAMRLLAVEVRPLVESAMAAGRGVPAPARADRGA